MTHVQHLKPFLRKTPFHGPMEALMHGNGWIRWMGYYAPAFFDSEQSEYFAVRTGASVYDVSPLIKYSIRGRDAARFMDYLVTRDMTKVKPMQVVYTAWCDDDGRMIEEGTVFRLAENDFILNAALHQLHWLEEAAYGFDVVIEEISEQVAALSLQGPTSREILKLLGVDGIERLAHFSILETTIDGRWLRIDRAGYTGDLGYELWVRPEDAIWLWEILFRLGDPYKVAPIGSLALDMTRIEAGFILVDAGLYRCHACDPADPADLALRGGHRLGREFEERGLFHRQAGACPGEERRPVAPYPDRHRDRRPQAGGGFLPLRRQSRQAGARPHHLGSLVAGDEEKHRLCPTAAAPRGPGPAALDRDLVSEGTEDRAQHGPLLDPQPHVLRPAAQEAVRADGPGRWRTTCRSGTSAARN